MRHSEKYLSAYIDGELDGREKRKVEAHIEKCSDCRKAFHDLERVDDLLSGMEEREPSSRFDEAVLGRFRRRTRIWESTPSSLVPGDKEEGRTRRFFENVWRDLLSPVPVMAVLAVIFIVTGLYLTQRMAGGELGKGEEYEIAESLDILKEYPLLQDIDLYEHFEDFQDIGEG